MRSVAPWFLGLTLIASSASLADPRSIVAAQSVSVSHLDALLRQLAQVQAVSARFVERKTLSLMRRPLVSEGRVYFARPGWIARWTETPERSVVLLKDGVLSVRDPGGARELDVSSNPVLRGFVEGFVHVLAGDRAALERDYTLGFTREAERWQLTLHPRTAALRALVTQLVFVGQGVRVSQMMLTEASGDQTVMDFSDVTLNPQQPASQRQRLFTLPAQ